MLGTGLVRISLRPLRRVAATASRVAELPLADGQARLSERVPDTNPRTEVGQVATAFNRMLGHVESALARRAASEARLRRFAADASHELRTPLAAIRGYAELARLHPGPVPDDVAHALARVESEAARMSVLVDELLLLARLDAGRPLASEPVDLTRLAIDATSDARVAGPAHRWVLELPDEPVLVRGDEHRLHQVIANLLSNARAHTPPGTTVTVQLAAPDPQHVELSVTDDGPGIPAALQPDLFDRFVRGNSARSRASGGTGLGLAIVDAVVAAHRGSVTLTSRPGRTRFVITAGPAERRGRRLRARRAVLPRRDAVVAAEPPGQMRLVGEPRRGRRLGCLGALGQQPAYRPQPQLPLVVAGRKPEGGPEGAVGGEPAATGGRGEVVGGDLAGVLGVQQLAHPVGRPGSPGPGGQPPAAASGPSSRARRGARAAACRSSAQTTPASRSYTSSGPA